VRAGATAVTVVTALVMVIVVVGVVVVGTRDTGPSREPVPDNVPPQAAAVPADPAATAAELAIPSEFLDAYLAGTRTADAENPDCHLVWNTLAGLGWVESKHGSYGKDAHGAIVGPKLDGTGGFMDIPDTDHGKLDGDRDHDRAVGPLQFLPESWRQFGDGGDPQNIADAAPAAARLLCSGDRDLRDPQDWTDAVFAYNRSGQYLADVRDAAANYALGQPVA
jgi:membrane-bound lytic murein transglycosylase B